MSTVHRAVVDMGEIDGDKGDGYEGDEGGVSN